MEQRILEHIMKLRLHVGQVNYSGYTNIDLKKHMIDLSDLDPVCGESECTEIILEHILNYVPYNNLEKVITHICSRLRHGGKIIIVFNDINSIIRKYNIGELDEESLNSMLYGNGLRNSFSSYYISSLINELGLDKVSIGIKDCKVTLIVERK